jgi:hypothetical protein
VSEFYQSEQDGEFISTQAIEQGNTPDHSTTFDDDDPYGPHDGPPLTPEQLKAWEEENRRLEQQEQEETEATLHHMPADH